MVKKIVIWVLLGLLTIIIITSSFFAHEYWGKPWFINNFFNRVVLQSALKSPEMLSSIHVLEGFGIKGHQRELDDESLASGDKLFQKMKENKKILLSYADEDLSKSEKLSKDIAMYLLEVLDDAEKFRFHNYPVNQLFGVQNGFPSFMESTHQVNDLRDAEDYVIRLSKVDTKFSQVLEGLKVRQEKGILPPRFVIDRVLTEMTEFVATPAKENILYTALSEKMNKAELKDEDKNKVLADATNVINTTVYPAYQDLINYFEAIKSQSTADDGFWKLPQGNEVYRTALKFFTTTDYSAEEIHDIGLREVARIQTQIVSILEAEGRDVSQGFTKAMEALQNDESFYYPDTDEGREQILKDYQKILDEINAGLNDTFAIRPEAGVEVKRIPEFKEKTAPGAYYNGASMDGSRPGQFYANLYDIKATPKYGMKTLAYHEGIPGHHFQVSIAQELESVPLFRRFAPFTAYVEGWALYAERLAWEMGFEKDPYDNIGRLQAELFRGVRLVVDTGIHHKRWTREEAIKYMAENTGMAQTDVVSEIERYIVMPGQATSYKIGMIKILELREKAKRALGEKFTLSDFHDVILKNGAVPLRILEQLVDEYIAQKS